MIGIADVNGIRLLQPSGGITQPGLVAVDDECFMIGPYAKFHGVVNVAPAGMPNPPDFTAACGRVIVHNSYTLRFVTKSQCCPDCWVLMSGTDEEKARRLAEMEVDSWELASV